MKRPSVIETLPQDDDSYFETAISAILGLLQNDTTGSIFIQRDRGRQYRLTLERCKEGQA